VVTRDSYSESAVSQNSNRLSRHPAVFETSHPTSAPASRDQNITQLLALFVCALDLFRAGLDELFLYLQFLGREPAFLTVTLVMQLIFRRLPFVL